jgi:hypothetical protein
MTALWLGLVGFICIWGATDLGVWYSPLIVGAILGLGLARITSSLLTAGLAALLAWGFSLAWQSLHSPIGPAAALVTNIMGFGKSGVPSLVLTLLVGLLLALFGAWVGSALRTLIYPPLPYRKYR